MKQITIPATKDDGERILEILESSAAKGSIELLYTRRPNAFLSYQKESDETYVYVVKEEDKTLGTVAQIVRKVYIGGEIKKLGYVCGLKTAADYQGNVNWVRTFIENLVMDDIDCYFCSIINENETARKLFEKKRKRTMNMNFLTGYTTYMMTPYFKFKVKQQGYEFGQVTEADEKSVIEFLKKEGRKKDFFPVIESLSQFTDLKADDFYFLKKENEIVAVGALWKQTGYRQYLVKKYQGILKLARCFNPVLKLLGYISLPKENEVLKFPMLSFFISKENKEEYYKVFLNHIHPVIKKNYGMYVIGTTGEGCMNQIFKGVRNIHFDTRIYEIEFILGNGKKADVDKNNMYLECGLL